VQLAGLSTIFAHVLIEGERGSGISYIGFSHLFALGSSGIEPPNFYMDAIRPCSALAKFQRS